MAVHAPHYPNEPIGSAAWQALSSRVQGASFANRKLSSSWGLGLKASHVCGLRFSQTAAFRWSVRNLITLYEFSSSREACLSLLQDVLQSAAKIDPQIQQLLSGNIN